MTKVDEKRLAQLENIRLRRLVIKQQLGLIEADNREVRRDEAALQAELAEEYELGDADRIAPDGTIVRAPQEQEGE